MNLALYKFSGDSRQINKTLTTPLIFGNVGIYQSTDILAPILKISDIADGTEIFKYNYAYLSYFDRYYFVNKIVFDGKICLLYLQIDVLYTYRNKILNLNAICTRSGKSNNLSHIKDNKFLWSGKTEVKYLKSNKKLPATQSGVDRNFVLITSAPDTND